MHIARRSPIWGRGRDADILGCVYLTLILGIQESRKFYFTVRNVATVDVSGMIFQEITSM